MKEYTITTTQQVTQEQIDDILVTAFEGGINYWCGEVRVKKLPDGEDYQYASEALTRGNRLSLFDSEDYDEKTKKYGVWHDLTLEKFLQALGEMKFDFDDYDASDADCVVQKAVFGEVIYS